MTDDIRQLATGEIEIDGLVKDEAALLSAPPGGKIQAIKALRTRRRDAGGGFFSLSEAKDIVDAFVEKHCRPSDFHTYCYVLKNPALFDEPLPERKVFIVRARYVEGGGEIVFVSLDEERAERACALRNEAASKTFNCDPFSYSVTSEVLDKEMP